MTLTAVFLLLCVIVVLASSIPLSLRPHASSGQSWDRLSKLASDEHRTIYQAIADGQKTTDTPNVLSVLYRRYPTKSLHSLLSGDMFEQIRHKRIHRHRRSHV